MWRELCSEPVRGEHTELGHVPRYQVERLMRAHGLRGVRRGRPFVTTHPDPRASRPGLDSLHRAAFGVAEKVVGTVRVHDPAANKGQSGSFAPSPNHAPERATGLARPD